LAAIRGGADVIQLRDKSGETARITADAERLLVVTQPAGIPLIINDHGEIAASVGAAGAHVGQEDASIRELRNQLRGEGLVGKSTHTVEQAVAAEAEGTDYIGYGPIFPTPTKPTYGSVGISLIRAVVERVDVPVVCIGGIDETNVRQVLDAGGSCVAVVRAVCAAPDPEAATRRLKRLLEEYRRAPEPSRR